MSEDLEARLAGLRETALTESEGTQLERLNAAAHRAAFQHRRGALPVLPAAVALVVFAAGAAGLGLAAERLHGGSASARPVAPPARGAAATASPGPTPRPSPGALLPLVSGDRVKLSNLTMVSATTGWTWINRQNEGAGTTQFDGYVLHTGDGARTWSDVTPAAARAGLIQAGFFLDANHGWVEVADPVVDGQVPTATVWRTVDAGATWKRGGPVRPPFLGQATGRQLAFIDANHGWAVSPGQPSTQFQDEDIEVDTTADGGATWKRRAVSSYDPRNPLLVAAPVSLSCGKQGATFHDPRTGWVAGGCLGGITFYRTDDGGNTWRRQALPGPAGEVIGLNDCEAGPCGLTPPAFTSARDGTMVFSYYSGGSAQSALYVTHDGGLNWTPHPSPGIAFFNTVPFFLDPTSGWAATSVNGADGSVATRVSGSADGGVTWTKLSDVPGSEYAVLDFVSRSVGYGLFSTLFVPPGGGSHLFRTADGGRTWAQVDPSYR